MEKTKFIYKLKSKFYRSKDAKLGKNVLNWVLLIYLCLHSFLMLFLLLWGVSTSLKTVDDFMENAVWLPKGHWAFENYKYVFQNFYAPIVTEEGLKRIGIEMLFLNSILYAGVTAIIQTFVHCWMAYLVQRFPNKFSKVIYSMVLIVNIVPIIGTNSSMLAMFKMMGIYDTFFSFYLMKFSFTHIAFFIFHAAFKGVSREFDEAARIDGAGEFRIFWNILFPMVWGVFLTFFLMSFIGFWNDYMTPLMYLPTHPTLAYGVYMLVNTTINGFNRTPMRMATCIVLVIPIIILFVFFRDKMMSQLNLGGIKE